MAPTDAGLTHTPLVLPFFIFFSIFLNFFWWCLSAKTPFFILGSCAEAAPDTARQPGTNQRAYLPLQAPPVEASIGEVRSKETGNLPYLV